MRVDSLRWKMIVGLLCLDMGCMPRPVPPVLVAALGDDTLNAKPLQCDILADTSTGTLFARLRLMNTTAGSLLVPNIRAISQLVPYREGLAAAIGDDTELHAVLTATDLYPVPFVAVVPNGTLERRVEMVLPAPGRVTGPTPFRCVARWWNATPQADSAQPDGVLDTAAIWLCGGSEGGSVVLCSGQ